MFFHNFIQMSAPSPFIIKKPKALSVPFLISSPHSGAYYPTDLMALSRMPLEELRKSEDSYVQHLVESAPQLGAVFLQASLARVFCDLNREAWELDASMFKDPLPSWCNTQSPRIKKGVGTIHKITNNGKMIYKYYLSFEQIKERIDTYWVPYHQQIQSYIEAITTQFGGCIILDVHSMPSPRVRNAYYSDIVLGDGFSQTCSPLLINASQNFLNQQGLQVNKNVPYSGGYITRHYGNPRKNIHVMQIEINKNLYMNENTFELTENFEPLRAILQEYLQWIFAQSNDILKSNT